MLRSPHSRKPRQAEMEMETANKNREIVIVNPSSVLCAHIRPILMWASFPTT
jgi:hypothetical protein